MNKYIYKLKYQFKIAAIYISILVGLFSCKFLPEPTPTQTPLPTSTPLPAIEPTPIILPSPDPLPSFLVEVRPFPSSIISQQDFHSTVIADNYVIGGPPPPPVEKSGYNSSVCVHLNVEPLLEPGDFLFWNEEVLPRTEIMVDGKVFTERAEIEYLAVYEPAPACICFFDCEDWEYPDWSNASIPDNLGCWFWPGFWSCYTVELEPGSHTASFSFSQTSGLVHEYRWQFGIVE